MSWFLLAQAAVTGLLAGLVLGSPVLFLSWYRTFQAQATGERVVDTRHVLEWLASSQR